MQKACPLGGVKVLHLEGGGRAHDVPAVFHQCWQAPDGRYAVALANWTPKAQSVKVRAPRLGKAATLHLSAEELSCRPVNRMEGTVTAALLTRGVKSFNRLVVDSIV